MYPGETLKDHLYFTKSCSMVTWYIYSKVFCILVQTVGVWIVATKDKDGVRKQMEGGEDEKQEVNGKEVKKNSRPFMSKFTKTFLGEIFIELMFLVAFLLLITVLMAGKDFRNTYLYLFAKESPKYVYRKENLLEYCDVGGSLFNEGRDSLDQFLQNVSQTEL